MKLNRHGMSSTVEYRVYSDMKSRCYNPNNKFYCDYGGRGITVSEDWLSNFENFLRDMSTRPSDNHSLERKDVNLGYSKENCKWETASKQCFNRRVQSNNTSGRTGVRLTQEGRWNAYIKVQSKHINLGNFVDFQDAVAARSSGEIKYYGFIKE